jgi:heavy metal translocating P-type ATPase
VRSPAFLSKPARALRRVRSRPDVVQLLVSTIGMASGGVARLAGAATAADALWILTTLAALAPAAVAMVRELLRRQAGVDVVAVLALAGSLFVGEYIAGAVIALMLSSGRWLEARASARARRELSALLERAPSVVHRFDGDTLTNPPLDSVRQGDLLLVAPGETVPVDGHVVGAPAVLDESALTGEAALVERSEGDAVRSGGINAGGPFRLRATASADDSTYASIVRLVREAETVRAPLVRMADRFAMWFVPLTLVTAATAWIVSRDPVRAVAVLVVATPCPLILAAPVALVAGMSRAARRGVVVKNGGALETLGRADVLLFDKTGTLTAGRARVADIEVDAAMSADEVLRLAASLDQVSAHALAAPIVRAALDRGLALEFPADPVEEPGRGIRGQIGGRRVSVGRAGYVAAEVPGWARRVRRRTAYEGMANVFVGVEGVLVGALVLEDPIRPDAGRTIERLRRAGIRRLVMVTGDHPDVAESVASALGVDAVHAETSPSDKVDVVRIEQQHGTVVMVGDGINDAPALARADVGVAMGARGSTASSEAADVVLLVDRLDRLGDALTIARRSHRIALESIVAGMGLSFAAMAAAALGGLAPVVGALVQEAIDVAVILNALRAHGGGSLDRRPPSVAVLAGHRVLEEHAALRRGTARIREVADQLGGVPADVAMAALVEVRRFLTDELLPHEHDEEAQFYPVVAPYIGGPEVVTTVRRVHAEIAHLVRVFGRMVDDLEPSGPTAEELPGLRRLLYGLDAVLSLHRSEEEAEHLMRVVDEPAVADAAAG